MLFIYSASIPSAEAAQDTGTTYAIWSHLSIGDDISHVQVIPDVNDDGHEDVFILSEVTGNAYIRLIDGGDGSIIGTSAPLGYDPGEALFVNGYVVVAKTGGLRVYDSQFNERPAIEASSTSVLPTHLQTFDGTDIAFLDNATVMSHLLSTSGQQWNSTVDALSTYNSDLLVLSPDRAVFACVSNATSEWYFVLFDREGQELTRHLVENTSPSDRVYLDAFDEYNFLYSASNDTATFLRLASIANDEFSLVWEQQRDLTFTEDVGFNIIDTNGDAKTEVITVWGGNASVYDGQDGRILYSTHMTDSPIRGVALASDIDEDGLEEVVVNAGASTYLVSFSHSSYAVHWTLYTGEGIGTIQDVDGDGRKEVLIVSATTVVCYWGGYDNAPPSIELATPVANSNVSSRSVTFKVKANDTQSGIQDVTIHVDSYPYPAYYNATSNRYEVTVNLTATQHFWNASIYDRTGYYNSSTTRYLNVDIAPPTLNVTSPTSHSASNTSSITVKWSVQDAQSTKARIDAHSWVDVGAQTEHTFPNLDNGEHTVTVQAQDWAGNTHEQAVVFTIDTIPPMLSTPILNNTIITSRNVTITWSCSDATSGITGCSIKLDQDAWYVYQDNQTTHTFHSVPDGYHEIRLSAADRAGNQRDIIVGIVVNTSLIGGPGWIDDAGVLAVILSTCALAGLALKRRLSGRSAAPPSIRPEKDTINQIKVELEMERLAEMLNAFKENYAKGELDKDTYLRLKRKYDKELQTLREE
jgi:hypothetical protein